MSLVRLEHPTPGVALITLDRPAKYNALSVALLSELTERFAALGADVRAVVLTGADPAFCAGLDLHELGEGAVFDPDALAPLLALPVPVIGAINGVAVTGGLEIALACDLRIGSERARFADTHARVGLVPAWGLTARLPQAVGQSWARQMSITGDFVDATTALRIGLLNEVVPHAVLLDRAVEIASAVVSTDAATVARIRGLYDLARDDSGAAALRAERDGREAGVSADAGFAQRRDDVFTRGRGQ